MSSEDSSGSPVKKSVFRRAAKPSASAQEGGETQPAVSSANPAVPVRLPGTKASVFSKTPITSSGLSSLDLALGGGLALGTVVCIIEDSPSSCHSLFLRHFVAQGIVQGHDALVVAPNDDLFQELPAPLKSAPVTQPQTKSSTAMGDDKGELRIAWRYKESLGAKQAVADTSDSYCVKLDLSERIPAEEAARVRLVPLLPHREPPAAGDEGGVRGRGGGAGGSELERVFAEVEAAVQGGGGGVLRVALPSFGDSHWTAAARSRGAWARGVLQFTKRLRGLLRGRSAVAMLSIPAHLAATPEFGPRAERSADYVIHLKSLAGAGAEVRAQLKEYSAVLSLHKTLRLGTLHTFAPDSNHFLLRVRRKLLQLDRLQASSPDAAPPAPADPLAF